MKIDKNVLLLIIVILILAGGAFYKIENDRKKQLEAENNKLRNINTHLSTEKIVLNYQNQEYKNNFIELKGLINKSENTDNELKNEVKKLIYRATDEKASKELEDAHKLIEGNMLPKAAFSISKIIENLLKDKYESTEDFKSYLKKKKKRNANYSDYLYYAHIKGDMKEDEYGFAKGLKGIRNEEGHENGVQKENRWIRNALFIGLGLVTKLGTGVILL